MGQVNVNTPGDPGSRDSGYGAGLIIGVLVAIVVIVLLVYFLVLNGGNGGGTNTTDGGGDEPAPSAYHLVLRA
jgi:uncharacterized membrane protein